jgi:predicted amino acid racemase
VKAMVDGGVKMLADARVENLKKVRDFDVETLLLRLPMNSQIEDVVKYADISLNSEIKTIKNLSEEAKRQNKIHKIIIMLDLGDLREGILPENLVDFVGEIINLDGIRIHGIGVNLTCYGAVIPDENNLGKLEEMANLIENKFDIKLEMISGGNSSSVYMIDKGTLPKKINNLRIGESLILGRETAYGADIEGTHQDAFKLQAEIVEVKVKDSLPTGNIGVDAFGNKPEFEDKGKMKRAICAIGQQDVDPSAIVPFDTQIEILGASSDHLILDVTNSKTDYIVGDIVEFTLEYGSILSLYTSEYVDKVVK